MRKQRKLIAMVMVCSMVLIALAGMANASNIMGYSVFKGALKETIFSRNGTYEISTESFFDSLKMEDGMSTLYMVDLDNKMTYTKKGYGEWWQVGDKYIARYEREDDVGFHSYDMPFINIDSVFGLSREIVKILEIMADGLSGTAKDCFTMLDNGSQINAKIDRMQMPEIVDPLMKLFVLGARTYSGDDEYEEMALNAFENWNRKMSHGYISSLTLDEVNIESRLDKNGNLTSVRAEFKVVSVDMKGIVNEVIYVMNFKAKDIGTTEIVVPEYQEYVPPVSDENPHKRFYDDSDTRVLIDEYHELWSKTSDNFMNMDDEQKHNIKKIINDLTEILEYVENQ